MPGIIRPDFYPSVYRDFAYEVLRDPAFRWRHPHMHQKVIHVGALSSVPIALPTEEVMLAAFLREQISAEKAFVSGNPVPWITLAVAPDSDTLELRAGGPILRAARTLMVNEVGCIIRYDSDPFFDSEVQREYRYR